MQLDRMMDEAGAVADALRVLVVEDEFLIRIVVADHLRDCGFRVVEAFSADEAIGLLIGGVPVDLIFTDVRMPGDADGMDLLAFVRDTRPHIPVIMTSGHLTPHQAVAGGAAAFLAKPCDLDAVVEALRSARDLA